MKTAYFDCFSGAGGDMIVAALLDAGLNADRLFHPLRSLPIHLPAISVSRVLRGGLGATRFAPEDMHEDHPRRLEDILKIIDAGSISPAAKERAAAVFRRLASAEAIVHNVDVSQVHFHEVGAVDSIVDIVATCIGLDALGVEQVVCSPLAVGGGTVHGAHGVMPVPAPATARLLQQARAPFYGGPIDRELLTPTAAAILTEWAVCFGPLPAMAVEAIGYGAGSMDSDRIPNVLRVFLGHTGPEQVQMDTVALLQCNIDDATPEQIGGAMDALFEAGVLDAFTTPIGMKHSRPSVMLSLLCEPGRIDAAERVLFGQGLTLGIRRQLVQRHRLDRKAVTVDTPFGPVRIKQGFFGQQCVSAKPEYADCAAAAAQKSVPIILVQQAALAAYHGTNR